MGRGLLTRWTLRLALPVGGAIEACGSNSTADSHESADAAAEASTRADASPDGREADAPSLVFAGDAAGALDGPEMACGSRPLSACGVDAGSATAAEELASCDDDLRRCMASAPADGCHSWTMTFDAAGCLVEVVFRGDVSRGEDSGYRTYRECLQRAMDSRRFPALAGGAVTFYESCFFP